IFVPGVSWTSARNWLSSSSNVMDRVVGPKANYVFEVQQYFDKDFTGTQAEAWDPTSVRTTLAGFTNWARERHKRGFLGEFGVGPDQNCLTLLVEMIYFMEENYHACDGCTHS